MNQPLALPGSILGRLRFAGTSLFLGVATLLWCDPVGAACPSSPPVTGDILTMWTANAGDLGCQVGPERATLEGDGRWQQFEQGQVVTTPAAEMVVAAYAVADQIVVKWEVLRTFQWDEFHVRIDRDTEAASCPSDSCTQAVVASSRTSGTATRALSRYLPGYYTVRVQGCQTRPTACQGLSNRAYVEYHQVDFSRVPIVNILTSAQDRVQWLQDRKDAVLDNLCQLDTDLDHFPGERFVEVALAKLMTPTFGTKRCIRTDATKFENSQFLMSNRDVVNVALQNARVGRNHVGTDLDALQEAAIAGVLVAAIVAILALAFSFLQPVINFLWWLVGAAGILAFLAALICNAVGDRGDYDMTLKGLMPIMFHGRTAFVDGAHPLDPRTYDDVLDNLLIERGGASNVREHARICGVPIPLIPESENHILMTETSRYLTNQMLAARAIQRGQNVDPDFDNRNNGLRTWMLEKLASFLVNDFHEYQARPYQRLTAAAIQNLFDFADDHAVQVAARNVLDYLAAKYAVSSTNLRRAAPFRRLDSPRDFPNMIHYASDLAYGRYAMLVGNTGVLKAERQGLVDWGLAGSMQSAALGLYRVHPIIRDLMLDRVESPAYERIVPKAVEMSAEIYYNSSLYLITAGGIFSPARFGQENGWALPTILIPARSGSDWRDMLRIEGSRKDKERVNTCVAPGFACGMNPALPADIRWTSASCVDSRGPWTFLNLSGACGRGENVFAAVYREKCTYAVCTSAAGTTDATFGFFYVQPATVGGGPNFSTFVSQVLAANGQRTYVAEASNLFDKPSGGQIEFVPNTTSKDIAGVVAIDGQRLPVRIPDWRLAEGPPETITQAPFPLYREITSGVLPENPAQRIACVYVDNRSRAVNRRLILDLSDAQNPQRALVPLPTECGCPLRKPAEVCPREEWNSALVP